MSASLTYKVLVVDDEIDITDLLQYNLEKEGYIVKVALDGFQALCEAKEFLPHLIIMDVMLPQMDGIETTRQLRELPELTNTYILFLTARGEEYAQVAAFGMGADDYITKPVKPQALLSRIRAIFNRSTKQAKKQEVLTIGNLLIDKSGFRVLSRGKQVSLPKKEFALLYFLAGHPGRVFNREELLQTVWDKDIYVLDRTVDVHIRKIREKIGEGYIKTVKGVGYMFELDE